MKFTTSICMLAAAAYAHNNGSMTIVEDGQPMTRYITSTDDSAGKCLPNGSSLTLKHNAGCQVSEKEQDWFSSDQYKEYVLMNKTFSVDVNLSDISCSCNAALTTVSAPGYGPDWQPSGGSTGAFYCDANEVTGVWCQEMDLIEANKYVSQTTPHKCDQSPGGYISNCDRGGCATNTWDWWQPGFGPYSWTINTSKTYRQHTTFTEGKIHVQLVQEGRTYDYDACTDSGYVSQMSEAFNKGMVFALSYWGDNASSMSWLDGKTGCQGDCDQNGQAIFSNWEISNIGAETFYPHSPIMTQEEQARYDQKLRYMMQ